MGQPWNIQQNPTKEWSCGGPRVVEVLTRTDRIIEEAEHALDFWSPVGLSNVEIVVESSKCYTRENEAKACNWSPHFSSQNRQVSKESSKGSRDGFLIFAATVAGVRNSRSPLPLLPCWEVAQSHLIQNLLCIRWNRCTDKKRLADRRLSRWFSAAKTKLCAGGVPWRSCKAGGFGKKWGILPPNHGHFDSKNHESALDLRGTPFLDKLLSKLHF